MSTLWNGFWQKGCLGDPKMSSSEWVHHRNLHSVLRGSSSQGGLLTHIWGARGMGQGRIAQGWGTHTSLSRQGILPPNMRRGVSDPHSLGGGCVCMGACLHHLEKVIYKFVAACYHLWLDCGYLLWLILILNVLFKIASSLHIIKESMHHSNPDLA